jgi:erythromycin esterase-like protein
MRMMTTATADPWVYTAEDLLRDYHRLESSSDLDPLLERIGDARYVLLGEASHGTHEYYTWRTALTKRLIREKGFSFVGVEGDWPDCYRINRYVKGYTDEANALEVLSKFNRWPTWMWANWEIAALATWMKEFNAQQPASAKAGFYGLDVYSLWESLEAMIGYLKKEDPHAAALVLNALNCFEPYEEDGPKYARAAAYKMSASCTDQVVRLLSEIRRRSGTYDGDREASLNTEMNAMVVANAEKYYRSMVSFFDESWNIRDAHMVSTLNELMKFHGPKAKAIVWEHNTHIGDARATDMQSEGLFNVGQLVREQHQRDGVVLVGFGSYEGSVVAGRKWGAPMEVLAVPPATENSIEHILHHDSPENKLLIFNNDHLNKRFDQWMTHRAIGVVYRPESEHGNYVPTRLASRYDAFLYIDKTRALHPIDLAADQHQMPETYPFGF